MLTNNNNMWFDKQLPGRKITDVHPVRQEPQYPALITDVKIDITSDVELNKRLFLSRYVVTPQQAHNLEVATRSQSLTETWMQHRRGRITSSIFGKVLTCNVGYQGIMTEVMHYYKNPDNIPAIKWGYDHEDDAKDAFFRQQRGKHVNMRIQDVGLVVDPNKPYMGTSPDGIVTCDCCPPAVLEVKCTYVGRLKTIRECLESQTFCLSRSTRKLKVDNLYYAQVQGQMALSKINFAYFVVYTTRDIHVELIQFDPMYWHNLEGKIERFFFTYILPEIVGRRLEKMIHKARAECICRGSLRGYVVACETCDRHVHTNCVRPKEEKHRAWTCSACIAFKYGIWKKL